MGPLTRRRKALTLVPLALVSGLWTAAVAGSTPGASAAPDVAGTEVAVPTEVIRAPVSVPVPGYVAGSVPLRESGAVVAAASTSDIPVPALVAYQRAAQVIDAADPGCHLPWELLAGVGRIESDHGRSGGSTLNSRGVAEPAIFGIPLNGERSTQRITDTDAGELDRDPAYDRAVGPMQFLPSTWSTVKVDADGDGVRDPQDIDDAALAAAVYLCSGHEDLGGREGQEAALFRYNQSREYADLVLAVMAAYATGTYTVIPSGTYSGQLFVAKDRGAVAGGSKPEHETPGATVVGTPAPPTPERPGASPTKTKGLTHTLTGIVANPAAGAATLLPDVMTTVEATTTCLRTGVRALDVRALTTCVTSLLR